MIKTLVSRGILRKIGVFAAVFLGGFCFSLDSFADTGLDFSVNVSDTPILEINLSDANGSAIGATTTMDVVPDHGAAAFNEKTMVVSVGTNNEWGYNLVMSVSNTSLISTEDGSKTIPTLTAKEGDYTCTVETASSCDFTANTWGYKLNTATNLSAATNYLPLQSSITLNSSSAKVLVPEATSVAFGSKVNANLAPGTYQTTINFAATANSGPAMFMQDVTTKILDQIIPNDGDTTVFMDSRDETEYVVGRLADGGVWMLDNLALDLTDSAILSNIDVSNTNASANSISGLKRNISSWKYNGYYTGSYSYSIPYIDATDKDTVSTSAIAGSKGSNKIGAYYNYCAATAGSYCYDKGKAPYISAVTEDICPKGWKLPTGFGNGDYGNLIHTAYSRSSADFNIAFSVPYSGYIYEGYISARGTYSAFWSASPDSSSSEIGIIYNNIEPIAALSYEKPYEGLSIRCLYDMSKSM